MKTLHCVYNNGRFADQYTLDLEGFVNKTILTISKSIKLI
jgi:hypothetical protein